MVIHHHSVNDKGEFHPLQIREMKIEHTINQFRFLFLAFIAVLDLLSLFMNTYQGTFSLHHFKGTFVFIALLPVILIVHRKTKHSDTFYSWIKYLMVSVDLLLGFSIGLYVLLNEYMVLPVGNLEFALLMSFILIFLNALAVLRLSRSVIIYSAIFTLLANAVLYVIIGEFFMSGLYTSVFIVFFSFFNIWVTSYILEYYTVNNKLEYAFSDLKEANQKIHQKNEEITSQSDMIREHLESLQEAQKDMSDSLSYAQKIQDALFNHRSLFHKNFKDHFVFFKPKEKVSGDFYWATQIDNKMILAVSDCTGHGVPGAFMTMLGFSYLNEIVNDHKVTEPDKILNELRRYIIETLHQNGKLYEQKDGMDISVMQIDYENNKLKFSGANTGFCFIPRLNTTENQTIYEFKGDRMPVSYHYKMRAFSLLELTYQPGDKFYLFTDGYIDQFGGARGKKFKSVTFRRMLETNHQYSMEEQRQLLAQTMENWLGERYEQVDDMTVLGFEV